MRAISRFKTKLNNKDTINVIIKRNIYDLPLEYKIVYIYNEYGNYLRDQRVYKSIYTSDHIRFELNDTNEDIDDIKYEQNKEF